MLKIQVGHSYFLRFDPKQWERAKPYPPLATLQVAALLRAGGARGRAVRRDARRRASRTTTRQLDARSRRSWSFYEDNFNFLSKMCLGRMREAACEMIAAARARGARVIVAGSDASDAAGRLSGGRRRRRAASAKASPR